MKTFLTKKVNAGDEVPLWYVATAAQIDALRGSGYSEAVIALWNDTAYQRVYRSLPVGYVVGRSPAEGYYAVPEGSV